LWLLLIVVIVSTRFGYQTNTQDVQMTQTGLSGTAMDMRK
jgi:hypothetical protein